MDDIQKTDRDISTNEENTESTNNRSINTMSVSGQINEIGYLNKKLKRIEILNYIIVVLLVLILALNFLAGANPLSTNQTNNEKELPKSLNKAVANEIINNIKDVYNSGDTMKLYNVMGEYARTLVSVEEFEKSLEQIKVIGKFNNAYYTHYEYAGYQDGADIFVLFYVAKYDIADGNATVTIRSNSDSWEIIGFKFNFNN